MNNVVKLLIIFKLIKLIVTYTYFLVQKSFGYIKYFCRRRPVPPSGQRASHPGRVSRGLRRVQLPCATLAHRSDQTVTASTPYSAT